MPGFSVLFHLIRCLIAPRLRLAAEIVSLRQQLAVLNRSTKRPQLRRRDRFFWVMLSKLWKDWWEVLVIVKPETVVKWHRQGFKLYWKWVWLYFHDGQMLKKIAFSEIGDQKAAPSCLDIDALPRYL